LQRPVEPCARKTADQITNLSAEKIAPSAQPTATSAHEGAESGPPKIKTPKWHYIPVPCAKFHEEKGKVAETEGKYDHDPSSH
jgi:hypothetical protein